MRPAVYGQHALGILGCSDSPSLSMQSSVSIRQRQSPCAISFDCACALLADSYLCSTPRLTRRTKPERSSSEPRGPSDDRQSSSKHDDHKDPPVR